LICDDLNNGNETIDLTIYNSNLVSNNAHHRFKYYNSLNGAQYQINTEQILNYKTYNLSVVQKKINVLVTDNFGCSSIAELNFTLIPTPIPSILDSYILCENSTVTITENLSFDSYTWSYDGSHNPSVVISRPGTYTLTVTENHGAIICSTTKTFTVVLSNPAVITNLNPADWTDYHNVITVDVTGLGNYEYSLDGVYYQDSPVFSDLDNGEFKVYVRDKNGCGVTTENIYLLMYPKYFTPNGDGFNDLWKVEFSKNEPNLKIRIFDKHGKFLKQIDTNERGWDGTLIGKPLPATDYWFVITRQNGKEHRGHFALKR
ncbi:T9SS type B sorting domain-containing protein, partial [Flavobacterium sp.]|uniref:T9SS type B sorting domain-containing protein n=1 Tax=Flavobacterium sp. TaxID=239 RepID=UPI0026264E39